MPRGSPQRQANFHFSHCCFFVIVSICLSACGAYAAQPAIETRMPPCKLEAQGVNVYLGTPIPVIPTIFQHAATATPVPPPLTPVAETDDAKRQKSIEARYAALRRLEYEVMRWTDVIRIPLGGANHATITVTFLSPELVQTVYLNNLLKQDTKVADIHAAVAGALYQFAARNELVFLVTADATDVKEGNNASHVLAIDRDKMRLMTAEDLSIPPGHDDPSINKPVTGSNSVFGYLYYPFAVERDGSCMQALDPTYNTKIIIQTESITVDGVGVGLQTWTIPYTPLLNTWDFNFIPDYTIPDSIIPPVGIEPPDLLPTNELPAFEDPDFQRKFARFVWGQITLANY